MADKAKVLISAFVGSDNLGDEAIFLSLAGHLARKLGGRRLTVASVDPGKTRRSLCSRRAAGLDEIRVRRRIWLALEIARHDVCVFGGGGIIQDQSSSLNLVYFLLQIQLARMVRKKVALAFVGVGPLRSRLGRAWTRVALSGIATCIVRDEESRRVLNNLGITGTEILCASDVALNLDCTSGSHASARIDGAYLLLSLRHWYGQHRFLTPASFKSGEVRPGTDLDNYLTRIARQLSAVLGSYRHLRVVAVPFFGDRDARVHARLFSKLSADHRRRVILLEAVREPCVYIELARSAVCVVAMRLHALILASLSAAPLVALSYSPKVAAFMNQLGLDNRTLDIESEPDVERLTHCVALALEDREKYRFEVQGRVRRLRHANQEALDALCKHIEGVNDAAPIER